MTTKTPLRHQIAVGNRTSCSTRFIINLLLIHSIPVHAVSSFACSKRSDNNTCLALRSSNRWHFRRRCYKRHLAYPSLDGDAPLRYYNDNLLESLRGGAFSGGNNKQTNNGAKALSKTSSNQELLSEKISRSLAVTFGATAVTILAILLSAIHWETIKSLFDKEKFRKAIIQRLNDIATMGDKGLILYTSGFVFWEACGLPTAVVETAAGMAFGFRRGVLGSFVGKTCGSLLAFALGRTLLADAAGERMGQTKSFELIERLVTENPMRSAVVVRYSPFPQLIKNFALSVTKSVTYSMFLIAIVIHGFPFSLLWAALGEDSSLRLQAAEVGEMMPTNFILNGLLVFVTVFGFVISPAVTGWWLTDFGSERVE